METTQALARQDKTTTALMVDIKDEAMMKLLADDICKGANPMQLAYFAHVCNARGLNPFAKQIYYINRGGQWSIQTAIDGFRLCAARSGDYDGQGDTEYCGNDGVWRTVWLAKENPRAARATVYRKSSTRPTSAVALFDEYAPSGGPKWKTMPVHMLGKCAEAQALRKAFPAELSGIYAPEEMDDAGRPLKNATPVPQQIAQPRQQPAPQPRQATPPLKPANGRTVDTQPAPAAQGKAQQPYQWKPFEKECNQILKESYQRNSGAERTKWLQEYYGQNWTSYENVPWENLHADLQAILAQPAPPAFAEQVDGETGEVQG